MWEAPRPGARAAAFKDGKNAKVVTKAVPAPGIEETHRLAALRELDLLDTAPSESFDRITRLACHLFDLPMAAISLTDTDRQWFKSRVGLSPSAMPRHKAPCAEVAASTESRVFRDLSKEARYADSPIAAAGVRFMCDLAQDARRRALVSAMIKMTQDLGYRVVGEGVETDEVATLLAGYGCDEVQGYFFARPL